MCHNTMNPAKPHLRYWHCYACEQLLSIPPDAVTVQCPRCTAVTELPVEGLQLHLGWKPAPVRIQGSGDPLEGQEQEQEQGQGQGAGVASSSSAVSVARGYRGRVVQARKRKASGMPKRPLNAFVLYCKKMRGVVRQENPEVAARTVGAELGRRWRRLSEAERKPYELEAAEDQERYRREVAEFKQKKARQ